jgi:hypothetical protein
MIGRYKVKGTDEQNFTKRSPRISKWNGQDAQSEEKTKSGISRFIVATWLTRY